ncbi:MAG: hypothetical protein GWN99_02580 [Gemmatimonadetes bacterium]|uniref:Uncharacterized protein n=1 Tax=Candidatus Kutchimonas denitrificans TaxID=3056748 RepID=A0AAE4ZA07_9BACT|nr:hypothetical protein [Gemmatimonadota bacterium]NIR74841.1 hypothetical protein [Candidatus Kutchimonas denitrificans]NIR99952.1 hypothetical protein [Gemmatimonadota bacterium]NIT65536.1 hypothetical protein [Gemmatimonadota bacterium]NIU52506.1 hypothetical protein [Gemmatimonadota bacterium]
MAVVVAVIAGLFCIGYMVREPGDVEVAIEAPLEVSQGERFTIVVRVWNGAGKRRTLVDLDIADEYLNGIVIESSEPPFKDAMHVPIDNTLSYSFDIPIAAGEEAVVEFAAFAAHSGDFQGDIDFCIDSSVSCLSYPVRTLVR